MFQQPLALGLTLLPPYRRGSQVALVLNRRSGVSAVMEQVTPRSGALFFVEREGVSSPRQAEIFGDEKRDLCRCLSCQSTRGGRGEAWLTNEGVQEQFVSVRNSDKKNKEFFVRSRQATGRRKCD